MTYTVTIQNTPFSFQVDEGESVLQAALRQEIPLPWGCGGGVCGTCMGQVVEGEMVYPDGDPIALFEEDAAEGKGLFCVGHPRSNLVLNVPDLGKDWEPFE